MKKHTIEIKTFKSKLPHLVILDQICYMRLQNGTTSLHICLKYNSYITIHFSEIDEVLRCFYLIKSLINGVEDNFNTVFIEEEVIKNNSLEL